MVGGCIVVDCEVVLSIEVEADVTCVVASLVGGNAVGDVFVGGTVVVCAVIVIH